MSARVFTGLLALVLFLGTPLSAQDLYMNRPDSLPPQLEETYLKGLAYLVKVQDKDGGWAEPMSGNTQNECAATGLSILALLAHGDDPNSGPYADAIKHGLDFLVKQQHPDTGFIGGTMYNHGFSTLALAEAYGQVDDDRLGPALEKAIAMSLTSQANNSEAAWRYSPESKDADTTVSGAIFVSLIAARNAGLGVPADAITKALAFYKKCALPGGGFGYVGRQGPGSGPRNAIGVLVLALARDKNDPAFKEGVKALVTPPDDVGVSYPFYYEYYASQAYFQSDVKAWEDWNQRNLKRLANSQDPEGNWTGQQGTVFSTAAALLSLALNYRFLPIYER
jgi:hypothetical protein